MFPNPSKPLARLLILTLLIVAIDSAWSGSDHAGPFSPAAYADNGDTKDTDEHDDHCCHAAGHLLGAVTTPGGDAPAAAMVKLSIRHLLLSQDAQAPPTPPPTR